MALRSRSLFSLPRFFPLRRPFSAAAAPPSNSSTSQFNLSSLNFDLPKSKDLQFDRFTELTRFYTSVNPEQVGEWRRAVSNSKAKAMHQLVGHQVGFRKYLKVKGVGYKFGLEMPPKAPAGKSAAAPEKEKSPVLTMNVGFSHLLRHPLPKGMSIKFSRKFKMVRFQHPNINVVTGMASYLRNLRKPDPYKGKGIRYRKDPVIIKEGKKKNT